MDRPSELQHHDIAAGEEGKNEKASFPAEIPGGGDDDVPPDGGYGWVVVGAVFFMNSSTWGINSVPPLIGPQPSNHRLTISQTYGVFLAHYLRTSTFPGATPTHYSFVGGLSIATSMLIAPAVTILLRRTSTRTVMLLGVLINTLSLLLASFSTQIWHLFLTQGLLLGAGIGTLYIGSVGTISQWFSIRRSLANGLAAGGSGAGGLVYSLLTRALLTRVGLAWTFRALSLCAGVVTTICALLIRDRNKSVLPSQRAFDMSLLRRPEMWGVLAWGFCSMMGYVVLLFSLPDYAASMGFSVGQGGVLTALLNAGMMLGRPMVGLASDRWGRLNVGAASTLLTGVMCFGLWLPAGSYAVVVVFAVLCGAVCGTFWTSISPITVEVVGIRELPSALSLVWLGIVLPTTFAECIALYLRQPQMGRKAYMWPQLFAGCMYMVAFGFLWMLRAWKIGDWDRKMLETSAETESVVSRDAAQVERNGSVLQRWRAANKWWRYKLA